MVKVFISCFWCEKEAPALTTSQSTHQPAPFQVTHVTLQLLTSSTVKKRQYLGSFSADFSAMDA